VTEHFNDETCAHRSSGRFGPAFHSARLSFRFHIKCRIGPCSRCASQKEEQNQEEEAKDLEGPPGNAPSKVRLNWNSCPGKSIA
jgi:hypothetical protein